MPKSKLAKFLFVLSVSIIALTLGANYYFMNSRPVVADQIPKSWPANWICQRVSSPSYCVLLSKDDARIYSALQLLTMFFAVPIFFAVAINNQVKKPD